MLFNDVSVSKACIKLGEKMQSNKELVQQLFENGVQFGHKSSRFHPSTTPYVWGVRNGMHLIDLNKTAFLLKHACNQIEEITKRGGQILWVGTKRQAQKAISSAGEKLDHPTVIHRWIGGTLTNSDQVRKAVTKLLHMRDAVAKPLPHQKKKQISMLKKELDRLEKNVSGIINLKPGLSLVVVVDVKRESTVIKEARRCGIPIVAIVDTNSPADEVDTVIPANDDLQKSVDFLIAKLSDAALKGKEQYIKESLERPKAKPVVKAEAKTVEAKPAVKPEVTVTKEKTVEVKAEAADEKKPATKIVAKPAAKKPVAKTAAKPKAKTSTAKK